MAAKGARIGIAPLFGAFASVVLLSAPLGWRPAQAQTALQDDPLQNPNPAVDNPDGLGLRGDQTPQDDLSAPGARPSETAAPDQTDEPNEQYVSPPPPPGAPNYKKPQPPPDPTQRYSGRPKTFSNQLPDLEPYPSAPILKPRGGPEPAPDSPAANFAQVPGIPRKKPPTPEADPFAPLGIDVGSLRLTPYVETDLGYDSNPNHVTSGAKGSPVLRGEVGMSETSLWSSNELTSTFEAGYSDYLKAPQADRPDGSAKIDYRLDASKHTALDFELRGALSTQQPGSPGVSSTLTNEPLVLAYGGTTGVTETLSRLTLGLHGLVDRTDYQNGTLSNGVIDPLSSENYTDYTIQGKAGYEITPGLIPFTEIDADTRKHDQITDAAGFERDSTGLLGQVGTTFEFSQKLTGSVAGGYLERAYQDPRLQALNAPVFNSSLVWSATPLTTVTLKGATTVSETTVSDASGEVSRNVSLGVSHALLRNVTLTGLASYQVNTYPGANIIEHDYLGSFGIQYSLSRSVVLKGTFTHEKLASTAVGSSYIDDVVMLGVRLQR